MTLREQIFELLNEINDNQERTNDVLDTNIFKIKTLIKKQKLNKEQTGLFLEWTTEHSVKFKADYITSLGGARYEDYFQGIILRIAFEIENGS